jgi:uncharacterized damage-inducible protein DinB
LDWSPGNDMNSLSTLVAHVAGAERYWIGDVVMGEDSGRVRDREFETAGATADELSNRLDDSLEYIEGAFERLSPAQLAEERTLPELDRTYTVAWSIGHALQHTAQHLGHMQITRQLLSSGPVAQAGPT